VPKTGGIETGTAADSVVIPAASVDIAAAASIDVAQTLFYGFGQKTNQA